MDFDRRDVAELLAQCHRRCCICHRFCGVKMETDHIVQPRDGGPGDIENAIPVCFDCHAEIHSYNDSHPRGRKFTPDELRAHKMQWLTFCAAHPEALASGPGNTDVGPLQALVNEIEFNLAAVRSIQNGVGCPLRDSQFERAIRAGVLAILEPALKTAIFDAYVATGNTRVLAEATLSKQAGGVSHSLSGTGSGDPREAAKACQTFLENAHTKLLEVLGS